MNGASALIKEIPQNFSVHSAICGESEKMTFMEGKRILIRHRSGGTWIPNTSILRAISSDLWCL